MGRTSQTGVKRRIKQEEGEPAADEQLTEKRLKELVEGELKEHREQLKQQIQRMEEQHKAKMEEMRVQFEAVAITNRARHIQQLVSEARSRTCALRLPHSLHERIQDLGCRLEIAGDLLLALETSALTHDPLPLPKAGERVPFPKPCSYDELPQQRQLAARMFGMHLLEAASFIFPHRAGYCTSPRDWEEDVMLLTLRAANLYRCGALAAAIAHWEAGEFEKILRLDTQAEMYIRDNVDALYHGLHPQAESDGEYYY